MSWAGALLAVGVAGSGCSPSGAMGAMGSRDSKEDTGGSLKERRVAQLQAQPFESFGDGKLQQDIKVLAPGTGGSGTVPGSGSIAGPAAKQQQAQQGSGQSAGPVWRYETASPTKAPGMNAGQDATQKNATQPRRDSGSQEGSDSDERK
jgi:hypothetical protein